MTHRRPRLGLTLVAALLVGPGCATGGGEDREDRPPTGASTQVITRADLAESHSRNAWEAIRDHVKFVFFREDVDGRPQRATRRGNTSMLGPQDVRVLLDGNTVNDLRDLTLIPVQDIHEIRVLSAVDATTYFGTGAVSGAVLIVTRR